MHCYICVTYLMIITTAHPPKDREVSKSLEKRSIFNDVIQSLRIRSQLPEDINLDDENNNIGQSYPRYGFETEPLELPGDIEFTPRRNDRIEMPTLKYRFPKNLKINNTTDKDIAEKEIVVYVNTPTEYNDIKTSTQKPKKQKRPRPTVNRNKVTIKNRNESESEIGTLDPFMNTMTGQSHIGNRESQTVVKPTVIVNFRGSVMHKENDIRLERRKTDNDTLLPQNIFNIRQEIKLERNDAGLDRVGDIKKVPAKVNQDVKIVTNSEKTTIEEDMMMCETTSWKEREGKDHTTRKHDVLQILVSI